MRKGADAVKSNRHGKTGAFLIPALFMILLIAGSGAPGLAAGAYADVPDDIEVVSIRFDFDGSTAIPLRRDYYSDYAKPEWIKDSRSNPALFRAGDPDVRICAWFEAPVGVKSALIWAVLLPAGPGNALRGVIDPETVHFSGGAADSVMFSVSVPLPAGLAVHEFRLQWKTDDIRGGGSNETALNISGPHRFYTVLDDPSSPWNLVPGDESNPWTDALDLVLGGVEIPSVPKERLQTFVTKSVFNYPVFEYDIWSGASEYTSTFTYEHWKIDLTSMIDDIGNGITRVGNCYDGAAAVVTFSNLLGCDLKFLGSGGTLFWGFTRHSFGYLNCIDPIGRGEDLCNNPFHESWSGRDDPVVYQDGNSSNCSRTSFGNHAFAGPSGGEGAVIWDATMKADIDGNRDTPVLFPSPDGDAVSSNLTPTVLTDETQNWIPGEFAGKLLNPNTKTNNPDPYVEYEILANTSTTITVASGDLTEYAGVNDHYWVRDDSAPSAEMTYLTGVPWPYYMPGVVDDDPSSNTDPPVECTLEIRSPVLSTGDIPAWLLDRYGVAGWTPGKTRIDVEPEPCSIFRFLEPARSIDRVLHVDREQLYERYYFLESEKGALRLTILTGESSEAVSNYLATRLCGPRTMAPLPPPNLPFGEVRLPGPGDICFAVPSPGETGFGRIDFVRGNVLVRLEGEGAWRVELHDLARRLDLYLLSLR